MIRTPNISICVVAKNAAKTIGPLFSSLREFADRRGDMVLVDTGSTDGTPDIYRAFGFRVFEVGDKFMTAIPKDVAEKINKDSAKHDEGIIVNEGDTLFHFADARNYAASLALNDYIMNPDADEAITVFDIDRVEEAFKVASRFRYDFVFSHNPDGSPSVFFVTDTRASDRRHWKWKGIVHETNEPISKNANMTYLPPTIMKLEHFQIPSPTRTAYLAGLAYACYLEPKNDRNLHYYGRELMYRHKFKTAIDKLKEHIALSTWDAEQGQSMMFIGDCYSYIGDTDKALEYWLKSYTHYPKRREPLMRMALYYQNKDNRPMAMIYAAAALEIPFTPFYGNRMENYRSLPHEVMYWARWWMGDKEGSKRHWKLALEKNPTREKIIADSIFYEAEGN